VTEELSAKKEAEADIIEIKNRIFEDQTLQISLRMRQEEIKAKEASLKEDLARIQEQLQENISRKSKIAEKIQSASEQFSEEASELRAELNRVQAKLREVNQHKEKVEDQA
jgi:seryl-tRNA synthetase